jgi:hypothetical protein
MGIRRTKNETNCLARYINVVGKAPLAPKEAPILDPPRGLAVSPECDRGRPRSSRFLLVHA